MQDEAALDQELDINFVRQLHSRALFDGLRTAVDARGPDRICVTKSQTAVPRDDTIAWTL